MLTLFHKTDSCSNWDSGGERMTVETISWANFYQNGSLNSQSSTLVNALAVPPVCCEKQAGSFSLPNAYRENRKLSQYDWKFVDVDVKHQNQRKTKNKTWGKKYMSGRIRTIDHKYVSQLYLPLDHRVCCNWVSLTSLFRILNVFLKTSTTIHNSEYTSL